ncbi:protein disulfide isomerase [Trametes versicolor FP-101664 SS1]|uniref:protein disulfide isomerase n=1 Tax=Trametes versicolor (strain FP-101664) TaxID=717944 RepID=UPI0004621579|nr:protein disulfide isomerase [Trametes versicolor FP-101664 SS1]EIW61974.1 protein disulfide isomerase [Trametes versicolor FP-101664 SS1]
MRFSRLFTSAAAFALFSAVLGSDVLDLTHDNFDAVVNPESLILVEFFAPWCGHCKALAPHYEEAATALKEKNIKIAKVNCVDEAEFCQTNGIQGYPTLRVYRNGEHSDYTGPRKADGIISYMTKQSLPAVSEVTKENYEDFKKADRIVALAFLPSTTAVPAPEFSSAANKHRDDYLFGLTTDESIAEAAGVTPPAIVVFRNFDEPQTEFPYPISSATAKEIEEWIQELSIPIIDEVGAENYQTYASSGKPLAYLFVDPTDEKLSEYLDTVRPVAAKFRGKVNFVWIDAVKFGDHARALNLNEAKWPSFVLQDLQKQLKYPYDQSEEITGEALETMLNEFLDGKLEPQLKSQPIPETQDEPVFELVGKQFEEVVFDDEKDVFVEFYATWCGHCKRLKPTWDSLGEHFANVKDRVTIVKMEATENDLPPTVPFRVSGFPTLKFKKAGTRDFIDYDGDRSLESLIAFVEENAKNPLDPNVTFGNKTPVGTEQVVLEHDHDHHDEL